MTSENHRPTTYVLMVADMSGSMQIIADDVRGGFNSYLDGLAAAPGDEDGISPDYRVTVTLFDQRFIRHAVEQPLAEVPRLTRTNYIPAGMTALYDAIGRTMAEFNAAHPVLAPGDKALLIVQTDGYENSSIEYTSTQVRAMMADWESDPRRGRVFLAAGEDTWEQGNQLGFQRGETVSVSGSGKTTRGTYEGLVRGTRSYSKGGSAAGVAQTVAESADGTVR